MAKSKIYELMSIGIDIGKDTFHIVAFDPICRLSPRQARSSSTCRRCIAFGHG